MKTERQGRIFPITDKSSSVVEALKKSLVSSGVEIIYGSSVTAVKKVAGGFIISVAGKQDYPVKKVIIATGGASYKVTGSTGDGFRLAEELGIR